MTGTVSSLTDDGGEIQSDTSAQCPYAFERAQFFGDYDAMKTDFDNGATVRVVYQTHAASVAKVVRRLE